MAMEQAKHYENYYEMILDGREENFLYNGIYVNFNALQAAKTKLKRTNWWRKTLKQWYEELNPEEFEDIIDNKWFLTIRPADDASFINFYNAIRTLFKRKLFKLEKLVFEQKGETNETLGKGKHIHAIVELHNKSKGKMYHINETHKHIVKAIGEDCLTSNNIDLKPIKDNMNLERANNYINTEEFLKEKEEKRLCWEQDRHWRRQMHLAPTYEGDLPILTNPLTLHTQRTP